MIEIIGYIGLGALAACWVPQTLETFREKDCKANMQFLILSFLGSFSLMIYAIGRNDLIFSSLNLMTSAGALINIVYKVKAQRIRARA